MLGLWKQGHAACGRAATLLSACLLVVAAEAPARADSFVRNLAQRALERGLAQEARGDIAQALTGYDEAVRTDTTLGLAALRLGGLRERMGDAAEAEWLYSHAAGTTDGAAEGYFARSRLRSASGRRREALADLQESIALAPDHPDRLRLLGNWYVEARLWTAALTVWRALAAQAQLSGNAVERREAEVTVTALSWLAGETDAVLAGATSTDWARRSLARSALARSAAKPHGVRKLTP